MTGGGRWGHEGVGGQEGHRAQMPARRRGGIIVIMSGCLSQQWCHRCHRGGDGGIVVIVVVLGGL